MNALFLTDVGQAEVRETERPFLQSGEVLLEVKRVGFCGSDLNGFKGLFPLQEYPIILGHEVGAQVVSVGEGVPSAIKVGDKVTLYPYQNCGTCIACRKDRPHACQSNKTMGVRRSGAMTEYVAAPWQDVFPSDKLTYEELALVEPLTVGFHAVDRGRVGAKDIVAVLGCGIVGLGAVASAVDRGAEVIAVDLDNAKLEIAKQIGVKHTINPLEVDLAERLRKLTEGDGPNVIIEAAGTQVTYRAAVDEVAFLGRVVCIGYAKSEVGFNTSLFVQKEIEILGSRNSVGRKDFPAVIAYLESGSFPVQEVITKKISLEKAPKALEDWAMQPKGTIKIMLDLSQTERNN